MYGLGGGVSSPGELSLTAALVIDGNRNESTLFVVYVLNSGGYLSKNTNVTTLPEGLRTDSEKRYLWNMNRVSQNSHSMRPDSLFKSKNAVISVSVDSDNLEPNQLKRAVELLGPPERKMLSHAKSVTAGMRLILMLLRTFTIQVIDMLNHWTFSWTYLKV